MTINRNWVDYALSLPRNPAPTQADVRDAFRAGYLAAIEDAAQACERAVPDRTAVRVIGEAAHYVACAAAVRAMGDGRC